MFVFKVNKSTKCKQTTRGSRYISLNTVAKSPNFGRNLYAKYGIDTNTRDNSKILLKNSKFSCENFQKRYVKLVIKTPKISLFTFFFVF